MTHVLERITAIGAVVVATTAAGAQSSATPRAADSALSAASARGVPDVLVAGMAADAVLLYPGQPMVRGRAAIAGLIDSLPGGAAERLSWRPMRAEVSADGTRGYTYGRGVTAPESRAAAGMHYIAWWRREGARWVLAAWLLQRTRATPPDTLAAWPCAAVASDHARLPVAPSSDLAARAAVLAADVAFAARASAVPPAVAFAEYAADDGVSLGARPVPACGPAQIGAQLAGGAPGDLQWAPTVGDAAASGDLGYTAGIATIRGTIGIVRSKYLTVWKRQADGSWRFVADGGSPMRAVPPAAR